MTIVFLLQTNLPKKKHRYDKNLLAKYLSIDQSSNVRAFGEQWKTGRTARRNRYKLRVGQPTMIGSFPDFDNCLHTPTAGRVVRIAVRKIPFWIKP
ncbi:MAG: hypothetical protein LBI75_12455 [Brucellaceae bacterium]|jgi:hypothetical protein|nr:hypothetical protein [Brucellaceae bacterium]